MVQPQQSHRPPLRPVLEAYVNVAAATYTAKAGDRVIGVNRAGAVTVTLPTAEVRSGRVYTVKDESGAAATNNNITVATEGSETIDGSATDVINVNYESKSYYSDGTNWFILPVTPDTDTQNSYEAPGFTLGTSNVEGSGNSIRSGATILAFDDTDPSTQAHSDAAAGGTATVAARRDHKHAMPAAGGVSQATQAAIEAETDENTYPPPDLLHFGPWAAKVWVLWEQTGAHGILASYNMTSVTDGDGAGDTDHLWATDFSGAAYAIVGGAVWDSAPPSVVGAARATTGAQTINGDSNHVAQDVDHASLAAFGDQ